MFSYIILKCRVLNTIFIFLLCIFRFLYFSISQFNYLFFFFTIYLFFYFTIYLFFYFTISLFLYLSTFRFLLYFLFVFSLPNSLLRLNKYSVISWFDKCSIICRFDLAGSPTNVPKLYLDYFHPR